MIAILYSGHKSIGLHNNVINYSCTHIKGCNPYENNVIKNSFIDLNMNFACILNFNTNNGSIN